MLAFTVQRYIEEFFGKICMIEIVLNKPNFYKIKTPQRFYLTGFNRAVK